MVSKVPLLDMLSVTYRTMKYDDSCYFCFVKGVSNKAIYDGKTKQGPWAYMCEDCFKEKGVGVGTGNGHKLDISK